METSKRKLSKEAIAAAKELRIKNHSLETKGKEAKESLGVLYPPNAKWLDKMAIEDAEIIDRHFAEFLKSRQKLDFVKTNLCQRRENLNATASTLNFDSEMIASCSRSSISQ